MFLNALPLFIRRISTVLSQGISHGMWLRAWEFLLINVYFISRSCIFFPDTIITTM